MSYREELEQDKSGPIGEVQLPAGAPAGARQNVRADGLSSAPSRPGGATQNSGGAIEGNADGLGDGPARGPE